MQAGGYQQPGTTVVVVQQPYSPYSWRNRGPTYLRNGVRMSGIVLSFPVIICLGLFGVFFMFSAIMTLSFAVTADDNDIFDDDDGVHPSMVAGVIMLLVGGGLIAGCISLACYAKKKYNHWNATENPGRVINPNPSPSPMHQPGIAAPTGAQIPPYSPVHSQMPPAGGYGPPPPMGPYPQPAAGQPYGYPVPTASPGGAVPPYPSHPVGETKAYPPPAMNFSTPGLQGPTSTLPGMAGDPTGPVGSEYAAPPPYAPDYKQPY